MNSLITKATKYYDDFLKNGDPRVANWPMMASPWPSFMMCLLYVMSVKVGIGMMAKRKPFEIRRLLVVYNISMMLLSGYMFVEFNLSGWLSGTYSLRCQPVDYSETPLAIRMAKVSWLFFISRFIEFSDTAFFILRKKFRNVSFLHVFHHGALPCMWWFGVKYVPGGFGTFHAMINAFIHFAMYAYYGLAAMGPTCQKYLWWKKHLTTLQLAQFIIVITHSLQLLFIECNYPLVFALAIAGNSFMMLVLFGDFYSKTYSQKKCLTNNSNCSHTKKNGQLNISENDGSKGLKRD